MATQSVGELVNDFINKTQSYADTSINKAFDSITDAMNSSNNTNWIQLQPNSTSTVNWPDNLNSPFTKSDIPSIDNNNFQYIKLYQDDWLEKYRLIMSENFDDLFSFRYAENKLEDILQNGYIIQKTVQDQIINRAVDQEMSTFNSRKDAILYDWSSKGWNIPSSFTISRVEYLQKEVDDKVSSINREYVIKNQDLYTEMLKFAIQESTQLLPKCVDIASSFAGKYSQVYNYGAENVKNYISGLNVVNESIRNYHSTLISRVQTGVQENQNFRDYDLRAKNAQVQFDLSKIQLNIDTTMKGVGYLASIGNAALNANQSIVNISNSLLQTSSGTNVV